MCVRERTLRRINGFQLESRYPPPPGQLVRTVLLVSFPGFSSLGPSLVFFFFFGSDGTGFEACYLARLTALYTTPSHSFLHSGGLHKFTLPPPSSNPREPRRQGNPSHPIPSHPSLTIEAYNPRTESKGGRLKRGDTGLNRGHLYVGGSE